MNFFLYIKAELLLNRLSFLTPQLHDFSWAWATEFTMLLIPITYALPHGKYAWIQLPGT